jgi:hypothetical protein
MENPLLHNQWQNNSLHKACNMYFLLSVPPIKKMLVEKIPDRRVDLDIGSFDRWKASATFAAEYFLDHYAGTEKGGLKIEIRYIHDMEPYDTNNMIVFYAVVQALSIALGMSYNLSIDSSGAFVIPR